MASTTAQNSEQLSTGASDGCQARGLKQVIIGDSVATRTLKAAESGATCLFDRAAGTVYTLPAPVIGMQFDFIVTTAITSNAAKIITAAATEFLSGTIQVVGGTTETTVSADGNGSTHVAISMNGTTTGAAGGGRLKFTALSSTLWHVDGYVNGSGTVATPFATS